MIGASFTDEIERNNNTMDGGQDPDKFTQFIPILYSSALAGLAGAVNYLNNIDKRELPFHFFSFSIEICSSALMGVVSFMVCDSAGWGWEPTAAVCAISGHMGGRAWSLIETVFERKMKKEIDA